MTHTLHRLGSWNDLAGDYVFLMMPSKGINVEGSGEKLRTFLKIALAHNPVSIGDARKGNAYYQGGIDNLLANVEDQAVVHAVFDNKETVVEMLKELVKADLGLSVVVSGITSEVHEACRAAGLERHTVEHSLGRWGRTDKLPPREILEITNMCGHSMVPAQLVYKMIEEIRAGRRTAQAAAEELAKPCMCGIFNTKRAARLLAALATNL
ncbi:MAG: hypothetical protein PWQ41_231 [Bacillota bacterium]|nr:hypothetical protein [Bacillota bacterium]MDK2855409.1 hypothetical protein [Bacillota bacterium]MDK2924457.1 hypothetical protein [Bacillota bacterium]